MTDPDARPPTAPGSRDAAPPGGAEEGLPAPLPDLRVARVMEARDHPNADRLLVMRIDLGTEERQIVAGIVGHYEPDQLVGLPIVVVANLQHAKLRGEVSQGMLLAAEDEEGRLGVLLAPGSEPGTLVRPRGCAEPRGEITFQGFHENTLLAGPQGVTVNGHPVEGVDLVMDREVYGKLR